MSILPNSEIQAITGWTLEHINMIATCFTAIGTVGATIVALLFGYRSGRIKLKVTTTFNGNAVITVQNTCERLVTITHVTWGIDRRDRPWVKSPVQFVPRHHVEYFPHKLEPGAATFLLISLSSEGKPPWLRTLATELDISTWEEIKKLRLKINTAGRYTKKVSLPERFLKQLEEMSKSQEC